MTEINLEVIKMGMVHTFSDEHIAAIPEVERQDTFFDNGVQVARSMIRVLRQRLDVIHIHYPATWWDAFKDRWYPAWAKRRWPIEYTEHNLDIGAIYLTLAAPTVGQHEPTGHLIRTAGSVWRDD